MSDVSQLIEQRFADNTTGDITPADAREVAQALALLAPNQRRDLLKAFRYYRAVDRDADPSGGTCLETDLDYATCCAQTVARVEFYRTSDSEPYRRQDLVCVYDGSATPAGLAWRSGDFSDGGRLPCKFVPVQSQQAAQANVPTYAANVTYPVGYLVRYSQAGGRESFYYSLQAGQLQPPTYNQTNAYWKLVPGPVPETLLYQYLTLDEAQSIDGGSVAAGRRYGVAGKWNGSADDQLVFLDGLDLYFCRQGTWLKDDGSQQEVEVSVGLGTFTAVATGSGGGVSQAQLDAKVDKERGRTLYSDDMAREAVGAAELQLLTTNALRVRTIKLTGPLTVAGVVKDTNADYLAYQVNYHNGTRWVAGPSRLTPAEARADQNGLDFTTAPLPELLVQVVPFVAADPALVILTLTRV